MVAEMQMMKERMAFMMNALKGWVSNDLDELVHRTDSPFTVAVTSFPLPVKFRMPSRVKGSLGPPGVIQNPHALIRCSGQDHVPSLPNYAEGSHSIDTFKELSM